MFPASVLSLWHFILGMRQSQPKAASVRCWFHVQNPSDADVDL